MPSVEALLDAARRHESTDPEIVALGERCRTLLAGSDGVPDLTLLIVDYERGAELRGTPLHTASCKVLLDPPTVLISERFLLELEAAVRAFGLADTLLGCQYLRSDEELFALVHRLRDDLPGVLARLRRRADPDAVEAVTLATFFFVAHEVGHLLDDADERSYATFIKPGAALETEVANAAMKLCRHVDEFASYGFDLPGGDDTADPDSEIRRRERELTSTEELAPARARHARFFADEVSADDAGARILIEHLARVAAADPAAGMRAASLAVDGLFTAGIYSWYRDLLTFGEQLGMARPPDARTLALTMLEGRETYINAASLFGDEHRFTLLRATLAAEDDHARAQRLLRSRQPDDLVDEAGAGRRAVVAPAGGRDMVGEGGAPAVLAAGDPDGHGGEDRLHRLQHRMDARGRPRARNPAAVPDELRVDRLRRRPAPTAAQVRRSAWTPVW